MQWRRWLPTRALTPLFVCWLRLLRWHWCVTTSLVRVSSIVSDNLTTHKPGYASAALGTRNSHGAGHHAVPCRGPDDRHDAVHPP